MSATTAMAASDVFIAETRSPAQVFGHTEYGVEEQVRFPVVRVNQNNRYSSATSVYTTASTGIYTFSADVGVWTSGVPDCVIKIGINEHVIASYAPAEYPSMLHMSGTITAKLMAGTMVRVWIQGDGACSLETISEISHFSGYKL
jgi:hypothetical protein